jgi:K+-transporting ATPase KdpF subunit
VKSEAGTGFCNAFDHGHAGAADSRVSRLLLAGAFQRPAYRTTAMMLYVLAALVGLLVIYLFYAVIHPERF